MLGLAALTVGCTDADIRFPEAGVDAARADSGRRDGGGGDDAATRDAGRRDAGARDGGADDAGGRDAGSLDAGLTFEPGAGELVITEVMVSSDVVPDDFGEWFELYNPSSDRTYDLMGCILADDGNVHVVGSRVLVPPRSMVALARSADPGFAEDYAYSSVKFANDGDSVTVRCGPRIVDRVVYDTSWPFSNGSSMQLDPASYDTAANDRVGNWCFGSTVYNMGGGEIDLGTPGDPNGPC